MTKSDEVRMVTMKVRQSVNIAAKILKKRYSTPDERITMDDALMRFIQEHEPELAKQAFEGEKLSAQLADLIGDDD